MCAEGVRFSIANQVAWAPGLETPQQWQAWTHTPFPIAASGEPGVRQMAPLLRRRAGQLGKMALEVAYACLGEARNIPIVFCSRHGEVVRAIDLLSSLALGEPLSPTAFGMAVHNASAALFSIARADQANQLALAAGAASVEAAVIEACGLLADGAPQVLLLAADSPLPELFAPFDDEHGQAHAFAWLLQAGSGQGGDISLAWRPRAAHDTISNSAMPASLAALRFVLGEAAVYEHVANRQCWRWSRHA